MPQGDGGPVAAISTPSRIQFAPIVGSTVEAATPLTQELAKRARERGIGIAGSGGTGATHILKGYFSAMSEGGSTTVIYVWDVLDPAGNRLHRIQGQAKADGKRRWLVRRAGRHHAGDRRPHDRRIRPVAVDAHAADASAFRLTDSLDYRRVCDDSACNSRVAR